MTQKLVLIRGLPGSGKSTLAECLKDAGFAHFEADMFHMTDGRYQFKPENIKAAHAWCQQSTHDALLSGHSVVVSNTFTQKWEIEPYLIIAATVGIEPNIYAAEGAWDNVHNVPPDVLAKMAERWEAIT